MKYLVIDAGGNEFKVDAAAVDVQDDPRKVTFYSDAAKSKPIAEFSAPTSFGPAPN